MKKFALPFLLICLLGCGRDTSQVEEAILGHWVEEENEDSHIYIDEKEMTFLHEGTKQIFSYTVVKSNDEKGTIELSRSNDEMEEGEIEKMVFQGEDRKTLVNSSEGMENLYEAFGADAEEAESTWIYVDGKTEP